jgi:hypothetical protein
MRIRNLGLCCCCLIPLLAQTGEKREEWQRHWDQHWAQISRLPVAATEELRAAAGISNGSDSRIESLDAQTLKNRDHILLTERAGGCSHFARAHGRARKTADLQVDRNRQNTYL